MSIIHTRKYNKISPNDKRHAQSESKKITSSKLERQAFLEKIRRQEAGKNEQKIDNVPHNKITDFFGLAGVYFLLQGFKIVYVGETSCLMTRLGQHMTDKKFDGFRFLVQRDPAIRLKLERMYIQKFAPVYNVAHNPNITAPQPIKRNKEDLSQADL